MINEKAIGCVRNWNPSIEDLSPRPWAAALLVVWYLGVHRIPERKYWVWRRVLIQPRSSLTELGVVHDLRPWNLHQAIGIG